MKLEIELNQQDRGIRFKNNLFIKKKDIDLVTLLNKKGKLDQIKILYPIYKYKKDLLPNINHSKSQDAIYFPNKTPFSMNLHYSNNIPFKLSSGTQNKKINFRQILFKHLSSTSSHRNSLLNTPIHQNKQNRSINYSYNINGLFGNNSFVNRNKNDMIVTNYNNRKCIYGKWNGVLTRNKELLNSSNNDNEYGLYGDNNISRYNEEHNNSQSMFETNNNSCRSNNKFKTGISKDFYLKPVHKFNKK